MATTSGTDIRALVVDDEKNIRTTLALCLESLGCKVTQASTGEAALEALRHAAYDLCFLDLRLANESGLDLLPRLLAERPGLDVVVITAYATFDTAVEAVKRGAADYVPKPFTPEQIRLLLTRLSARRAETALRIDLEARLGEAAPEVWLETASPRMRAVMEVLARAAAAEAPVLLRGEGGSGKGVLARALHAASPRRSRPFATVSCPTLAPEQLAVELFGLAKGAAAGGRDQAGKLEAADGGTLFIDEIADLPPALQPRLLRFLQERVFERVGDGRTRAADVRVVAATSRDLVAEVKAGRFGEELLYRLNVVEIQVPPLRDRPEDILPLARRFLAFFAAGAGRPPVGLAPAAERAVQAYRWPGNVRELRNVMERAVILCPAQVVEVEGLGEQLQAQVAEVPALGGDFTADDVEREHILRVLARAPTMEEAARILGIDASTLWRKRKKLGR